MTLARGLVLLTSVLVHVAVATSAGRLRRVPLRRLRNDLPSAELKLNGVAIRSGNESGEIRWSMRNVMGFAYVASFDVGTPRQSISLMIDPTVPYADVGISTPTCEAFSPERSTTSVHEEAFVESEESAVESVLVPADLYYDTFAGMEKFAFLGNCPCFDLLNGVLGLSLRSGGRVPSVLEQLVTSGWMDTPTFAIYMSREGLGELVFGGADASHYTGDLNFIPLLSSSSWRVAVDAIALGEDGRYASQATVASFSPGYGVICGPEAVVQAMARVAGANRNGVFFYVDCAAPMPRLTVTLGGRVYALEEDSLKVRMLGQCLFGLQACDTGSVDEWILGAPFTQKYYTLFDGEALRVGVAIAASGIAGLSSVILP